MRQNEMDGPFPDVLCETPKLKWVHLDFNKLTGSIPKGLAKINDLRTLTASNNQITGPLPESIGTMLNLDTLLLGSNKMNGTIPKSLANLKKLGVLDLSDNSFTGEVPDIFESMTSLTELGLSHNKLSGRLPQSLTKVPNLAVLEVGYNSFTSFDEKIMSLNTLSLVDLRHNQFTQKVPAIFGDDNSPIIIADLAGNQWQCPLPEGSEWTHAECVKGSENGINKFTKTIENIAVKGIAMINSALDTEIGKKIKGIVLSLFQIGDKNNNNNNNNNLNNNKYNINKSSNRASNADPVTVDYFGIAKCPDMMKLEKVYYYYYYYTIIFIYLFFIIIIIILNIPNLYIYIFLSLNSLFIIIFFSLSLSL